MTKKRSSGKPKPKVTFESACALVDEALSKRPAIIQGLDAAASYDRALLRLVEAIRSNVFSVEGRELSLKRTVNQLDKRTQDDGFHVLNDWDGKADRFNENTIPVDVAAWMVGKTIPKGSAAVVLAILLDYYFLYVIALLALRAWEEGDANENLDAVTRLIGKIETADGSGQSFLDDAETLIIVATAHFESDEMAYVRLLEKVKGLNDAHRLRMALSFAAILGSHLRFGFEVTYGRDMVALRNDNFPDYPWLSFALDTLMVAYDRVMEGAPGPSDIPLDRVVEGLANGLSPDPRAFVGEAPDSLSAFEEEVTRFKTLFGKHRDELLEAFESHEPSEDRYSPIAFYFNFVHNVLKGTVVDALLRGKPWSVSLNALLRRGGKNENESGETPEALARTLMDYARKSPDTIRGRPFPVILYDPRWGKRAFTGVLQKAAS